MFLKSIELFGFKSFPERTRLEFRGGVNALLGPNGCGKSNVVDAVKWVLGEQSARSLRADSMEDVIFNGTESRKALSVAEVTLLLANDTAELPLDMPEVAIRRRLYRSGDSEYTINNAAARLRDVRELFFDTGIGKSAYSIMEQGRIDQILSTRPEDRRYVFEEAAGITRYRARGVEAERKLERTRENIRQVNGILGEVKRSHDTLQRQAGKTEKYRALREEIFQTELEIQLLRLKGLEEQRQAAEEKLKAQMEERDRLKTEIDATRRSLEQSIDQVNSMESRLVESQKELYRIDLERRNALSQIRVLQERKVELERKIAADEERGRQLQEKIRRCHEEVQNRERELAELERLLGEVERNIGGFERDIQQFEQRIQENEQAVARLGEEVLELEHAGESLRVDLRRVTDDIVTQLDQRLKELGYSASERRLAEEKIGSVLKAAGIQASGKRDLLGDLNRLGDLPAAERNDILASVAEALEDISGKVELLRELFEDYRKHTPVFLEEFLAPEGIITRKRDIDRKITEALEGIASRRARAEEHRQENRSLGQKIVQYRRTLEELRINRARMNTQRGGLQGELRRLGQEIQELERTLAASARELDLSRQKLGELQGQAQALQAEKGGLDEQDRTLKQELSALENEIHQKNRTLSSSEETLKRRSARLERTQAALEKLQVSHAEIRAEIRSLHENFSEIYSRDLSQYAPRMRELTSGLKELRSRLARQREALKALGQVNLMAPEEFAEVRERYHFLTAQLTDLDKASGDLERVTAEIRTESSELFLDTYNTIRKNFHAMFRRLFGGGRAELRLLDPSNVLESGIDIYAQPPGKKLESINLLSGGERAMTAIGLLFAVFMVRPSPFCILDEIDAALDEQNVGRFVGLLKEFAAGSQFIVITHNKKTVASADTLLGVTMEESGVSKIVALRLENKVEEKSYA